MRPCIRPRGLPTPRGRERLGEEAFSLGCGFWYNPYLDMKIVTLSEDDLASGLEGLREEVSAPDEELNRQVAYIVADVRRRGDEALFEYTARFDGFTPSAETVLVEEEEWERACRAVPERLRNDLASAAARIRDFHERKTLSSLAYTDNLGNELGWLVRPIERAGIYVPGGKAAYPSTVLMTVIPAVVAGVEETVVVTPCPGGEPNPAVLAAARIAGASSVYKVGGAQAVAALAYGTESIPRVDKIVGPGNKYVAKAKQIVYGDVDIDSIAGPSEVLIIADGSAPPKWVAADLLAQAEHDEDAVAVLVTTSRDYAQRVSEEVEGLLATLPRRDIAGKALSSRGRIFVVPTLAHCARVANAFAPEHLEICITDPHSLLPSIRHAGAVFLGPASTEAFGDYVAGPSHVLPTGGTARFASPLGVLDFLKFPSLISISERGFDELADCVMRLAESEGLEAHALSVRVRMEGKRRS